MRWRVIAIVSLGVNIAMAAVWLLSGHSTQPGVTPGVNAPQLTSGGRTNVVLRRQLFSWHEVESADYPTYISNLRDIGCPEQTIRDIIIADVNSLYARRRASELVTPEQQWWRSQPDSNVVTAAAEKARTLEDERRGLLASLLGTNWESGDLINLPRPSRPGVVLDGPILGQLTPETKQALQELSTRSEEKMESYLAAQQQQGKNPDPAALAELRKQTRDELARVLSPPQLEEYLLRYSQYATNLRSEFGQLQFFNPTPDEFRSIFRATDNLDQRIQALANATDPNSAQARRSLQNERENAIKVALGAKRYQEYRLLHDPLYRDAVAQAEQAGTPEAIGALYAINIAAAQEQQSIVSDTNMTAEQKNIAVKSLQVDQLKANTVATGGDLPPEPPPLPPTPPRRTYTMRPGDSAAVVAMIYGVPEAAIRAANPTVDFNRLRPGDSINIPRAALVPSAAPLANPITPTIPAPVP